MRQSEPARILSAFWWVYSITIIYTYNGTLIAFLTIPSLTNLINSLDELANQRDVLWTYRSNSAHEMLFANAPAPGTYNKIGKLLAERPDLLVRTDQDGVEAVLGGHIAFIKEKSWLDFAMEADYLNTRQCRLSLVNHYFFSAGYGWALQSESPFLRLFNAEFLKMAQSGLLATWKQTYWPKPNECSAGGGGTTSGPKSLKLKNFSGHFFIFGVGQLLALLCFAFEKASRKVPRE